MFNRSERLLNQHDLWLDLVEHFGPVAAILAAEVHVVRDDSHFSPHDCRTGQSHILAIRIQNLRMDANCKCASNAK